MSTELSIGYLTGSAKVTRNYLFTDDIIWRNPRTTRQMFFQPYESKKEFIYCARHTFQPMAILGLAILNPYVLVIVPIIMGGLSAVFAALGGISKLYGNESAASFYLDTADFLIKDLCQAIIDLVVLPVSAVAMLTRGIATGVQAVGITGKHTAPKEEFPPFEALSPSNA
ncbi:hypothetical protein [Legionella jamestowniensis]|uniref:Uncharacterized protein n=1 Tax=Legionella jamestowniensis TaxID=455 RepID=A0A0W0UKM2_9GAMM|nr:hypothetical protein [Legionella jamestowniensis]KTD08451.1 hypothetical protein Ljam_2646 [Legionella jamestowniensis]OCH97082.1 hypothetical protein A8135_05475 [Legionella jamestowniensis]SFL51240.1 hypothetical protein SAMN02746073_0587 [Legionella jamestowniensis DSM 19215]